MSVHMGKTPPHQNCKKTSRQKTPTFKPSATTQFPECTNCLASSEDGRYLGLGHSQGFSIWCASSLIAVAEWLHETVEITFIQITRMAETTYVLGTIDDMGVARVFAYHNEDIHLLCVLNIMENVNKRSICLMYEMSEGGDYAAASISCNGAVWLEVYSFPSDVWQKELEMALLQEQDSSGDVDLKWSPASMVFKITPSKMPADGPLEDFFAHCLALDTHISSRHQQEEQASNADTGKIKAASERRCTHHFLLPCGRFIGESRAKPQSVGFPVALCVWWSGSQNLLQYLLQKAPKKKSDVEPVPDELWPNANEILCSAVSRSTRYVALGLDNGVVCVWDRQSGSPLSVVSVSAADSAFLRIQFVDNSPLSADDSHSSFTEKVQILVLCKSGAIHTVTTGRETQSCTMQLTDLLRTKHSGDLPTVVTSVQFLQNLLFVLQRNGKMFLLDVINNTPVCLLVPLSTHPIASPCNPVYALNAKQKTLFIKGLHVSAHDLMRSCSVPSPGESQSQLLVFRFGESDVIKQYIISPRQQTPSYVTREETCDLYLQQRALSLDERRKAQKQTWNQLKETEVAVKRRHSRSTTS
ncbi:WD repeat-containing protein 93 isoform X2 [Antennarius striatus]|uniref:WD repeat-containing protein 93 isoform X2 n=1 Tax=Antennarius striatus TaxID=241820 RepID=UPI0035B2E880